jgi:hypothetical protein
VVGVHVDSLNREEVRLLLDNFIHGAWGNKFDHLSTVFGVTSLGAIVMGVFFGLIGGLAYRIVANRTAASYALLRAKIHNRKLKNKELKSNSEDSP